MWRNKPFLVFFVAISLAAVSFGIIGWKMSAFYVELNLQGATTMGMVTHDEIRSGSRWGSNHYYFYTYEDITGTTHSGNTTLNILSVGAPLEITYLTSNPGRHVPFRMTSSRTHQPLRDSLKFSLSLLCLAYVLAKLIFWGIRRSQRPSA